MKSIKKYIIITSLLLFYFFILFINNLNFNNIENLQNIEIEENEENLKHNTNNDKKNEIQNIGIIKPRWGYYKETNEPAMWNGYSDPDITEYNN